MLGASHHHPSVMRKQSKLDIDAGTVLEALVLLPPARPNTVNRCMDKRKTFFTATPSHGHASRIATVLHQAHPNDRTRGATTEARGGRGRHVMRSPCSEDESRRHSSSPFGCCAPVFASHHVDRELRSRPLLLQRHLPPARPHSKHIPQPRCGASRHCMLAYSPSALLRR